MVTLITIFCLTALVLICCSVDNKRQLLNDTINILYVNEDDSVEEGGVVDLSTGDNVDALTKAVKGVVFDKEV